MAKSEGEPWRRRKDGVETGEPMPGCSNQVALAISKKHRETALEAEDVQELRERTGTRLEHIRDQDEERRDGGC